MFLCILQWSSAICWSASLMGLVWGLAWLVHPLPFVQRGQSILCDLFWLYGLYLQTVHTVQNYSTCTIDCWYNFLSSGTQLKGACPRNESVSCNACFLPVRRCVMGTGPVGPTRWLSVQFSLPLQHPGIPAFGCH